LEGTVGGDKMKEASSVLKSQIQIEIPNLDEGKAIVENILLAALDKFNIYDNSHTSRVSETIRSIVEGKGFGFGLGARVANDIIYVDFCPGKNNSSKFNEVHRFVLAELRKAFQLELKEIEQGNPAFLRTY
jgi:hypothetical protein